MASKSKGHIMGFLSACLLKDTLSEQVKDSLRRSINARNLSRGTISFFSVVSRISNVNTESKRSIERTVKADVVVDYIVLISISCIGSNQ